MTTRADQKRQGRAAGAVLGTAVGDALGAPFEFGPEEAYSQRFPVGVPAQELCGGGGWDPGEATDDTQMAVLVGESLLDCRGFDGYDMFSRFRRWAEAEPKDIGLQTETVLTCGLPWDQAADDYLNHNLRAAGNGSLMRTATAAVYYARSGNAATMDAARRISALTHGDPAAGEGCAILHELIRTALNGGDPLEVLDDVLDQVYPEQRERWAAVLDPHWHPDKATENNGAVWPALGTAVWALRTADDFEDALRRAVDQGGDTDTVAAVTGALSGAVYGLEAVPDRWLAQVHVPLPGSGVRVLGDSALRLLAQRLEAEGGAPGS